MSFFLLPASLNILMVCCIMCMFMNVYPFVQDDFFSMWLKSFLNEREATSIHHFFITFSVLILQLALWQPFDLWSSEQLILKLTSMSSSSLRLLSQESGWLSGREVFVFSILKDENEGNTFYKTTLSNHPSIRYSSLLAERFFVLGALA